jgi:hypothetical protein
MIIYDSDYPSGLVCEFSFSMPSAYADILRPFKAYELNNNFLGLVTTKNKQQTTDN